MELPGTFFLIQLYKKKPTYFQVWFGILMQVKPVTKQRIRLVVPPSINRVTYYRIVDYGIGRLEGPLHGISITRDRDKLEVSRTAESNKPITILAVATQDQGPLPSPPKIKRTRTRKTGPPQIEPHDLFGKKPSRKPAPEKPQKPAKKKKAAINYAEILSVFNDSCPRLHTVDKVTKTREGMINARIREYSLEAIGVVFQKTSESNWLNGENPSGWKASFDWVMTSKNFTKIIENNYQNHETKKTSGQTRVEYSDDFKRRILEGLRT